MIILLDNGHGFNTAGKRSPDGKYYEWAWTREVAQMIAAQLNRKGYDARCIVTEANDINLIERCRRVNTICKLAGAGNVLLVSIHSNASGNGQWMPARGWCAFTSPGQTKADKLATCLYDAAQRNFAGMKIRTDFSDGDPDLESAFYILKNTVCPSVLTENFFHDNRDDVAFIMSDAGKRAVVQTHIDGILEYINRYNK